jgi:hypothetical protein
MWRIWLDQTSIFAAITPVFYATHCNIIITLVEIMVTFCRMLSMTVFITKKTSFDAEVGTPKFVRIWLPSSL